MRVAVLSDTHAPRFWKRCPPAVADRLAGVDLILHAGDVCTAEVLAELEQWAPVRAVLGNNDGPGRRRVGREGHPRVGVGRPPGRHDPRQRPGGWPGGPDAPPVPRRRPGRVRALAHSVGPNGRRSAMFQPRLADRSPTPTARHDGRSADRRRRAAGRPDRCGQLTAPCRRVRAGAWGTARPGRRCTW